MRNERTIEKLYNDCVARGNFVNLDLLDHELIQTILKNTINDLKQIEFWEKEAKKESGAWNAIYKLYYDLLHSLVEAFVYFDKVKIKTHECLFAFICQKHPELELDWKFFDKIRTNRNGSLYYGKFLTYNDWKEAELQTKLYIKILKREIESRLKI